MKNLHDNSLSVANGFHERAKHVLCEVIFELSPSFFHPSCYIFAKCYQLNCGYIVEWSLDAFNGLLFQQRILF